jgi:F0F1-type ATP synthase membrane subunit c/vacuolar-type H+-ATPase subunit K
MKNLDILKQTGFKRLVISLALLLVLPSSIFAQPLLSGTGVAISVPVADERVQDGDIVAATEGGYRLSDRPYQPSIYGVVTKTPALFLENGDDDLNIGKTYPLLKNGKAYVRVSSINGNIKRNDFITSSEIKGVGQKSTANGFVLGTALEDYSSADPNATGKILAYINPHFNATFIAVRENLIQNLKNIASSPTLAPLTTFRYILAAAIAVGSFIIGFIHFGRIVKTGLEALGRNPLASIFIQVSVLMNIALTMGIVLAGLAISYLILSL